jgi:hypothetical protein
MAITVLTNEDDPAAHQIAQSLQTILLAPAPDPRAATSLSVVKTVFGQLAAGHLDRALLTSDANAYFTEQALKDFAASLQPLREPVSVEETGASERGGMSYRHYRVKTHSKALSISTFFTPEGKLDQFLVYPAP